MVRPVVTAFTEDLYDSLPEAYRFPDAALDYPLLRFLSIEGDSVGGVLRTLIDRIDPATNGGVSALLDANQADPGWLPWLAQLRGISLPASATLAARRAAIAGAAAGYGAGTVASFQAALAPILTGTKTVRAFPRSVAGDGTVFDILVLTRPEETPTPSAVVPTLLAAGVKPAGFVLHAGLLIASYAHLRDVHGTYTALEATFPTYQSMTSHIPE